VAAKKTSKTGTRKAGAKKSGTRKAGTRKKVARKKTALAQIEAELPATLRDFTRRVRRGLGKLEKRIEKDRADRRRRTARMLRDVSHRLGHLEAQGEREWRRQSLRARRATAQLLHRLERAVEPPRKRRPRKSGAAKTKPA
jgi:hypothetical protein